LFDSGVFDAGVFDATGAVTRVVSFGPSVPSIGVPLSIASGMQILIEPAALRHQSRRVGFEQLDDGIGCMFVLDHFAAKNSDIEILRFILVAHGKEVSCEEAFVCNRRVR
jgi:hypothetical protein